MARKIKGPLAGLLACTGGLAVVTALAYRSDAAQRLDATLRVRLLADPGSHAEALASGIARLGDPATLVLGVGIACGIGLVRKRPRDAAAALLVVAGANLTTQVLKVLFSHPRFRSIVGAELAWDGFPSGHTTAVASLVIAYAFVLPSKLRPVVGVIGTSLVIAVGWSVLALAWHFPSDVVGGVFVAGIWGFGALTGVRLLKGERRPRPAQLPRRAAISVK